MLSVIMRRAIIVELDFERLDPSDAIENFQHRAHFKGTRRAEAFEAIMPFTSTEIARHDVEKMALPALMAKVHQTAEDFKAEITKLRRQPIVPIPEPNSVI